MQTSAEEGRIGSMQAGQDATNLIVSAMDTGVDKQRFLEFNHTAFMIPKKFEFQGQKDEVMYYRYDMIVYAKRVKLGTIFFFILVRRTGIAKITVRWYGYEIETVESKSDEPAHGVRWGVENLSDRRKNAFGNAHRQRLRL